MKSENYKKINETLLHLKNAYEELNAGVFILNEILGAMDAQEDVSTYRRTLFRLIENNVQKNITLEQVNAMLVELNIKIKARQRSDGLFEIRPCVGGKRFSIYGKSAEELAKKYRAFLKNPPFQPLPVKTTLFSWFDEWLETYKKPNIAENTYQNIVRCVNKHIKPNLKDKALSNYTLTELTNMLNAIDSTRMRKYARGILREAFNTAVSAGKCTSFRMCSPVLTEFRISVKNMSGFTSGKITDIDLLA